MSLFPLLFSLLLISTIGSRYQEYEDIERFSLAKTRGKNKTAAYTALQDILRTGAFATLEGGLCMSSEFLGNP